MSGLKPCPFCGSAAKLVQAGEEWYVGCANEQDFCYCAPWTGYFLTAELAIEIWNRRYPNENPKTRQG